MEDPVPTVHGVAALSGSALQASKLLYQTIEGLRPSQRAARQVRDEVHALSQSLEVLKNVAAEYESELSALCLLLSQCGAVCKELSNQIAEWVNDSDGRLQDWTRVEYLGENISSYRNVLANYKATIRIALFGVTFQSSAVTRQVLHEYKDLIQNTISDLHDRLGEIEGKLSTYQSLHESDATLGHEELQKIEDEKRSTTDCLEICKRISDYIEKYQSQREARTGEAADASDTTRQANPNLSAVQQLAQRYLVSSIQNMSAASARLQERLNQLEANLRGSENPTMSDQVACDVQEIKKESEIIAQCLNIFADASSISEGSRVNIFEDVKSLDDAQQVLVSTIGYLLNAKRISTGSGSLQMLGQMSDETVQLSITHQHGSREDVTIDVEPKEGRDFHNRYGTGRSLRHEIQVRQPGTSIPTP
ncbi:hypothetical protein BJY01DRAFT_213792 [Aspergillus pseudoustus]|uniref:Azaphilone pigments biosynthesis cluster protein L N-terminal domain-containing protein n=1 Tax=Aspergillus pseudoustus TaxID=1810923 RepID=A0ABR4K436_9EURO